MSATVGNTPLVFAADAGSVSAGNFAWASSAVEHEHGRDLTSPQDLALAVTAALSSGTPVALGIEAPLSIPLAYDPRELTRARPGEGNRPWSAGAGSGALATGFVELTWILGEVRRRLPFQVPATLSPDVFARTGGLLLWEAFVSSSTKGADHVDDARAAVVAFLRAFPDLRGGDVIADSRDGRPLSYLSLAGAALLRSGWTTDVGVLEMRPVVLRAAAGDAARSQRSA